MLDALVRHYDRLAETGDVAAYGFSRQKLSFCVTLRSNGELLNIAPLSDDTSGKPRPLERIVPGQSKPSGSGINPCLLWDNAAYMLGHVPPDADAKKRDRAAKTFEAFRKKHVDLATTLDDPGVQAVATFLAGWNTDRLTPEQAETLNTTGFGAFRLQGQAEFVHDAPAITDHWRQQITADSKPGDTGKPPTRTGTCLITGQTGPLARLHEPKIKGVTGAQSSGATLVSFNEAAFTSHGLDQGLNAPVSEAAAFKYATALNRLLADRRHRVQLGDTTCVFWTEATTVEPADALADGLDSYWFKEFVKEDHREADTNNALLDFLNRYRGGKAGAQTADIEYADASFHILGLAPNAARISVRFRFSCTVRELAERLERFQKFAKVSDHPDAKPVRLRSLLRASARDWSEIKPHLAGAISQSYFSGTAFPPLFANAVLKRIAADGEMSSFHASALKAYLLFKGSHPMDVYLNKLHPAPAYHAGRLFATLAWVQREALGDTNSNVTRKHLAATMAAPALHLGRLQRNATIGHFHKLDTDLSTFADDELTAINCRMKSDVPRHLTTEGQTLFALGMYQQSAYLKYLSSQISAKHRYRSNRGEWMRSKLEVKVANCLASEGLNYHYEPSACLASAGERWPDFLISGQKREDDVYIEVAGFPGEEYDRRHRAKIEAYQDFGVSQNGGEKGRLIVLDYRKDDSRYDDQSVLDALRFLINSETISPLSTES